MAARASEGLQPTVCLQFHCQCTVPTGSLSTRLTHAARGPQSSPRVSRSWARRESGCARASRCAARARCSRQQPRGVSLPRCAEARTTRLTGWPRTALPPRLGTTNRFRRASLTFRRPARPQRCNSAKLLLDHIQNSSHCRAGQRTRILALRREADAAEATAAAAGSRQLAVAAGGGRGGFAAATGGSNAYPPQQGGSGDSDNDGAADAPHPPPDDDDDVADGDGDAAPLPRGAEARGSAPQQQRTVFIKTAAAEDGLTPDQRRAERYATLRALAAGATQQATLDWLVHAEPREVAALEVAMVRAARRSRASRLSISFGVARMCCWRGGGDHRSYCMEAADMLIADIA